MDLRWTFLLVLTLLMAVTEQEEPDPHVSEEPPETGKKCSLLSLQKKVLLLSWCKVAVYLYHMQGAVALSERTGANVHIRAQDT